MGAKFTLSEGIKSLPKKEFKNESEKYESISGELDVILEKMVRDGQLNMKNGNVRINIPQNSAISKIDEKIADKYSKETGFNLKVEYVVVLSVSVPTFIYNLKIESTKTIEDIKIDLSYKINGKTKTIKSVGEINKANFVFLNLNEIFEKEEIHVSEVSDIKVLTNKQSFDLKVEDTLGKTVDIVLTLKEEENASTN